MADKIGFIGVGNMGGALIRAICRGTDPKNVLAYDLLPEKVQALADEIGCTPFGDAKSLILEADFIVFAVKPQVIGGVLREAASEIKSLTDVGGKKIAVSIAAGVNISTITDAFSECGLKLPVIRVMPNMAAFVGKGVMLIAKGVEVDLADAARLAELLAPAGIIEMVTEAQLDLGCAISGCGPAYAYLFVEALADAGVQIGLPRDMAIRLAAQTLAGAAEMVLQTGEHPGVLKDSVTSPGGTTIAGIHALEVGAFRGVVANAVIAANDRNTELSKNG